MATLTQPAIIAKLLRRRGYIAGDPPVYRLYCYQTRDQRTRYAVFYRPEDDDLARLPLPPNVQGRVLLLERGRLTPDGDRALAALNRQTRATARKRKDPA